MGYLPQEESIFRKLTVRENILAVMETQNFTRKERDEQCEALLEKFGIAPRGRTTSRSRYPAVKNAASPSPAPSSPSPSSSCSTSPSAASIPSPSSEIQEIIRMLRSAGLAILITDHNVRETLAIVDRAYLIFEGQVQAPRHAGIPRQRSRRPPALPRQRLFHVTSNPSQTNEPRRRTKPCKCIT